MTASTLLRTLTCAVAAAWLGGCASGPAAGPALEQQAATPPAWFAPLPHGGGTSNLSAWWQQFNDPVLSEFISAAQAVSASVAQAASRIEQSRAAQVATSGALLPQLDAQASGSRGRQDLNMPLATTGSAGVVARWELDVFGAGRAARSAADQRLAGAQASWHDARVLVAAEVANRYIELRSCLAQVRTAEADALSRAETARLTELAAKAGFQAPANSALARASSAQGANLLTAQKARCDLDIKALVALTALDEGVLRQRLERQRLELGDAAWFAVPQPAQLQVTQVPGQVLAQRPDVAASEREWRARQADVAQRQAQRLPQISLSGNVSAARSSVAGVSSDGTVWSLGPLTVTMPLFDGGTRRANVSAAQAGLVEAGVSYRAAVRTAVREVEEALINLQSTADREGQAQTAATGFADSFKATEARYRAGLASLFELEDARRTAVQAQSALIDLQRERSLAWVSLYRALGGGWSAKDLASDITNATTPSPLAQHVR
jgi:multidrug efflux system outer membrane protein